MTKKLSQEWLRKREARYAVKWCLEDMERDIYVRKRAYEGLYPEAPIICEIFLEVFQLIQKYKDEYEEIYGKN